MAVVARLDGWPPALGANGTDDSFVKPLGGSEIAAPLTAARTPSSVSPTSSVTTNERARARRGEVTRRVGGTLVYRCQLERT